MKKQKTLHGMILFLAFVLLCSSNFFLTVSAADYSNVNLSNEEKKLISTLCYYETKDEPILSKFCFCSLILNRLKDERFPNNVRQIVFDTGAFISAEKGLLSNIPDQETIKKELGILEQVISKNLDPTCGSVFTMKTDDPCLWEIMVLFTVEDRAFGIVT